MAIFGIVAVDTPRDAYLQRLLDFQHSLRRPTQTQFGLFGTRPRPRTDERRDGAVITRLPGHGV